MKRVVITGVGVVSAFGVGAAAFYDGLAHGRAAVGPIRSFDAHAFPVRVAGEVPVGAIDSAWIAAHGLPVDGAVLAACAASGAWRDRKVVFGLLAALEAWRHAGCTADDAPAALSLALGLEQAFLDDFAPFVAHGAIDWRGEAAAPASGIRIRSDVDLAARVIARALGLTGMTYANASACAAGGLAVAHAASLVERGAADIVLCGGADSMVNPLGIGGMARLGAASPRSAADACRPFDSRRDGLAVGEGAAMFVVESEERARRRGARPLARIVGHGSTQDAYRVTAPRPDGMAARRAMAQALRMADLAPPGIGYVNAHGTGTPLNDVAEARAIRDLFGAHADVLPVSSIKGAVGHLMAAAGAIELAACLLPFERDLLPGTANHVHKDPQCAIDVIGPAPRAARVDHVLCNSFGFGGQNASVILGRPA